MVEWHPLEAQLIKDVEKTNWAPKGCRILISSSGGPDSTALTYLLYRLRALFDWELGILSVNHNLRPEGASELELVKDQANTLGLPFYGVSVDVGKVATEKKVSLETAGRQVRYEQLSHVAASENYDCIVLGHHKNDQAETILAHLFRGAGLDGLVGMEFQRGKFVRPLLQIKREDLLDYVHANNLTYALDQTNQEPMYERNRIRLEALPLLATFNPQIVESLTRMGDLLREDKLYLDRLTEKAYKEISLGSMALCRKGMEGQPKVMRFKIWRKSVTPYFPPGVKPTLAMVEEMDKILFTRGEKVFSTKWMKVYYKYDTITFVHSSKVDGTKRGPRAYTPVIEEGSSFSSKVPRGSFMVPQSIVTDPLVVRTRKSGDIIVLLRKDGTVMGHKKLKAYLIDRKVPRDERDIKLWLATGSLVLCEANEEQRFAIYDPGESVYVQGRFRED